MATPGISVRPLWRTEYERLVEAGEFDRERIELLRGQLIAMSPQKAAHAATVSRLGNFLPVAVEGRAVIRVQLPLAILNDSEPEPDVAVVVHGDYDEEHPNSALLVIEVADTSLAYDRGAKASAYAEAGIPEYWVVDLVEGVVEVHLDPAGGRYTRITPFRRGEVLCPQGLAGLQVAVDTILPSA